MENCFDLWKNHGVAADGPVSPVPDQADCEALQGMPGSFH